MDRSPVATRGGTRLADHSWLCRRHRAPDVPDDDPQSLLRAEVSRTFHLASAGFGLTEVRCLFLALNVAFYLKPPVPLDIAGTSLGYGDMLGIAWIVVNLGLYLAGTIGQLSREEPPDGKDR